MTFETLAPDGLDHLDRFSTVLVSGPQRAGTNFVTRAIEHDTALEYVPESAFQSTWAQSWWTHVQMKEDAVIHCPGMCRYLHMFGPFDEVAVVIVRRPLADIVASQERIGWQWEPYELMLYDRLPHQGPIAQVKYTFWEQYQREKIRHAFEVNYDEMDTHSLWVPKEDRADFGRRQVFPEVLHA